MKGQSGMVLMPSASALHLTTPSRGGSETLGGHRAVQSLRGSQILCHNKSFCSWDLNHLRVLRHLA